MLVTRLVLLLLGVALTFQTFAGSALMTLAVSPTLTAEADYWPGEADRPAVLVVHGFLQTRDFPTVRRLAEALADDGFAVLLPSLSLGLDRRRQSLACEAIHTHSMQQDIDELGIWIDWLTKRSGRAPILIGHSSGGVQLAALLSERRDTPVERAVLVSPTYFGGELAPDSRDALLARARRDLASDPLRIARYSLTFCRNYVTGPGQLLSYLAWDSAKLGAALGSLPAPVALIIGDHDRRVDHNWIDALRDTGVDVRTVEGANHFFDLTHEFDLYDEVLAILDRGTHG